MPLLLVVQVRDLHLNIALLFDSVLDVVLAVIRVDDFGNDFRIGAIKSFDVDLEGVTT